MNDPVFGGILFTQSQVNDVDGGNTYDKCIVPYKMSNATQETNVINNEMDQGDQMAR